ncbi:hypothetical protein B0H65DRAFT_446083 [Neurospora tetraspora]|uniref:Uncharacterized protein n=1 Tax=Neurospora tetraspora TaxID=94610 RepID=A0AAE0J7W3_9PEZI|nr:hypothetical protein B0H65DRAFT_446083 [Neurospora tetraspora]
MRTEVAVARCAHVEIVCEDKNWRDGPCSGQRYQFCLSPDYTLLECTSSPEVSGVMEGSEEADIDAIVKVKTVLIRPMPIDALRTSRVETVWQEDIHPSSSAEEVQPAARLPTSGIPILHPSRVDVSRLVELEHRLSINLVPEFSENAVENCPREPSTDNSDRLSEHTPSGHWESSANGFVSIQSPALGPGSVTDLAPGLSYQEVLLEDSPTLPFLHPSVPPPFRSSTLPFLHPSVPPPFRS